MLRILILLLLCRLSCYGQNEGSSQIISFCETGTSLTVRGLPDGYFYSLSDSLSQFERNGESSYGGIVCCYSYNFRDSVFNEALDLVFYQGSFDVFELFADTLNSGYFQIDTISVWCYDFKSMDISYNGRLCCVQSMTICLNEFQKITCTLWINKEVLLPTQLYFVLLELAKNLSVEFR